MGIATEQHEDQTLRRVGTMEKLNYFEEQVDALEQAVVCEPFGALAPPTPRLSAN